MLGLTMDYELDVAAILRRGEELFGHKEIKSRLPDKSWHTYTYADFARRAKQLALALRNELGLADGDRVATFSWNHHEHMETYLGAPIGGFVTHTLNLRLHPDDLTYIATHAGDRVLIADKTLWPLVEAFKDRVGFEHVVAVGAGETPPGAIDFEELLATADADTFSYRNIDERSAAAMCYTSGTTGKPKGVVYSHRAIVLHSLAATQSSTLGASEADVLLPVVPMFHANAWGFPFTCTLVGSDQVFPGQHMDPTSLLDAFVEQKVTVTAGVPTIWMGILQLLDAEPDRWDLSRLRSMIVGGAAAPQSMIEGFEKRHGLHIVHAWGMTEMAPMGTISALSTRELALSEDEQYAYRAKQGLPAPLVEIRARAGERPGALGRRHDGRARGAWPLDLLVVLRGARRGRPLDRRRVVQDRGHRHDREQRLRRDPGSLEGSRQVRRRVDLDRRTRKRADGPSGNRRGSSDRGARREMVGASARGRRVSRGPDG